MHYGETSVSVIRLNLDPPSNHLLLQPDWRLERLMEMKPIIAAVPCKWAITISNVFPTIRVDMVIRP